MKNNKSWTEGQTKIYEMVTNSIIAQLEKGEIPWKKPWTCGGLPKNLVTQKQYRQNSLRAVSERAKRAAL